MTHRRRNFSRIDQATRRWSTPTLERALGHRHRRGVVYVESFVFSGIMTLMLAGTLFFHAIYNAKLDTVYQARVAAWQAAMPGCTFDGVCRMPELEGDRSIVIQDPNVETWASSLHTYTAVSCNEPARLEETLNDALDTFRYEIAKIGQGTWSRIGLVAIFKTVKEVITIGYEAAKCLYDLAQEVRVVDLLVPIIALVINFVAGFIF